MKILDKTTEELISILISGYKRDDYTILYEDVKLPLYIEKNIRSEFELLKQMRLIQDYSIWITGGWEIDICPGLLTYFDDKLSNNAGNNNINNFYGNLSGVQIQQGTINSFQKQTINNEFNYEAVKEIIDQIKKYDSLLDTEFGDRASELRERVEELETLVDQRKDSNKVIGVLKCIKDLAIGVSGSLIASGILSIIGGFV